MKPAVVRYIFLSIICFLILATVQFILVSNTYELKNERYYFSEKNSIREGYSKLIRNDKLFPGGGAILDTFILPNLETMARVYRNDRPTFEIQKQYFLEKLFHELRSKESIQAFLTCYKKEKKLEDSLDYGLMIESLALVLDNNKYVTVYDMHEKYPLIRSNIQEKFGIRIGGKLKELNEQNKVIGLSITGSQPNTYKIGFRLYVEPQNRRATILRQMIVTLVLSLFSILFIVSLFFFTFRNWLRQKKLSEMKSDFINNITHELHTPLAAIIVANKNLQNEKIVEKKDNIRPLTEIIQRQADRLKTLIGEVLQIAATDQLLINKKEYSLHALLDEILLDYRLNLSDTRVDLSLIKEVQNDKVYLDKFHFTTILLNIFDNAIKYNDKDIKKLRTVTQTNNEGGTAIRITDNGIGMTRETIKYIFDKFYRSSTHLLSQVKGLGLGLYFTKQSVAAHNWSLTVESEPGEGSTFIITIPPNITI